MAKLFHYDNPVWRFMGRVADVFLLTILWAVCSLPIITIGASTSALYYVTLKMARNRDGYLCRSFLKAFKDNFLQATGVWLILLAGGMLLAADLYFFYHMESQIAVFAFWLFFMLAILYLFVAALVFPLQARLDTGVGKLFLMAFMTGLKNFSWVLLMLVTLVCIVAIGVFVFWPVLLVSAGAVAYIHSFILEWVIFPKYKWDAAQIQE